MTVGVCIIDMYLSVFVSVSLWSRILVPMVPIKRIRIVFTFISVAHVQANVPPPSPLKYPPYVRYGAHLEHPTTT